MELFLASSVNIPVSFPLIRSAKKNKETTHQYTVRPDHFRYTGKTFFPLKNKKTKVLIGALV